MKYKQLASVLCLLLASSDPVQAKKTHIKLELAAENSRLSDKMKDLSAKLPETKVLENKLTKMMTLQPQITTTLNKLDKVTSIPDPVAAKAKEEETKTIVKQIEKATDGTAQQKAFKKEVKAEIKAEKVRAVQAESQKAIAKVAKAAKAAMADKESAVSKADAKSEDKKSEKKEISKKLVKTAKKIQKKAEKKEAIKNMKEAAATAAEQAEEQQQPQQQQPNCQENCDSAEWISQGATSTTVVSQKKCKPGQDEVFDNCIKVEEGEDEEEKDAVDVSEDPSNQMDAKEYSTATLEMVSQVTHKLKLNDKEEDCCEEDCGAEKIVEKLEKKAEEKKEAKVPKEEIVQEAVKQAEKVIKKQQKKVAVQVKKAELNKEAAPGGILDLVSRQLAKNAKVQDERDRSRASIETTIKTRIAAGDTSIKITRDTLKEGLKATKEDTSMQKKEAVKAVAKAVSVAKK